MNELSSDFLVAIPRTIYGLARLFDFGAAFDSYNRSQSDEAADTKALLCDWYIVGQDFKTAMNHLEEDPQNGTRGSKE